LGCDLFQVGLVHKVSLSTHQIPRYGKQGHYSDCQAETSDKDVKALVVQSTKSLRSFFIFFLLMTQYQLLFFTNTYKQKLLIFYALYPCCSNHY